MRADMAAAYLDFEDTSELMRAISRGDAPPPIGFRGTRRLRQPVWSKATMDHFAASTRKRDLQQGEDLLCLV
ncbi:hypothetical protein BST65_09875 [Bradyrhizobium canariense]|nr:hypothetical protein BST65_09875 [Bradyrhizobium canariense]OSI45618.1 hypothetical protein BSZ20_12325 [Bradyrhizobium canariense]OSI56123.1 hypothetical protein BSZ15_17815 [Bradyrhizobium canariense]